MLVQLVVLFASLSIPLFITFFRDNGDKGWVSLG